MWSQSWETNNVEEKVTTIPSETTPNEPQPWGWDKNTFYVYLISLTPEGWPEVNQEMSLEQRKAQVHEHEQREGA